MKENDAKQAQIATEKLMRRCFSNCGDIESVHGVKSEGVENEQVFQSIMGSLFLNSTAIDKRPAL